MASCATTTFRAQQIGVRCFRGQNTGFAMPIILQTVCASCIRRRRRHQEQQGHVGQFLQFGAAMRGACEHSHIQTVCMHESMLHACAAVRAMAGTDLCYSCVLGFEIEKKNTCRYRFQMRAKPKFRPTVFCGIPGSPRRLHRIVGRALVSMYSTVTV